MKKLLCFFALFVMVSHLLAKDSGKIIIVGDIHEFLTQEGVNKIVAAAGQSGLILIPGDLLHHPYSIESFNPKIVLSSAEQAKHPHLAGKELSKLTMEQLKEYDEIVVGWFRNAPGAEKLAGIAAVLGNHEFHRGEKQAVETLKGLHKTPSKVKILNDHWYDFNVNGYCIRVIGYPAWQRRYLEGKSTEKNFPEYDTSKYIKNIVKYAAAKPTTGKQGFAHPYGTILLTHQFDNTDMAMSKRLDSCTLPRPFAIVGGHSHSVITFTFKNGHYVLKRVALHLNGKTEKWTTYDPVKSSGGKPLHFSIPILKTGWHNQTCNPYYSIWFPEGKRVEWFGPGKTHK